MLRLLLLLALLASCTKTTYKNFTETGRIVKLSVEPGGWTKYRVFTLDSDQSYWELEATKTKLAIGEKPMLTVEYRLACYDGDCDTEYSYKPVVKATIELPACSAFRDTQKYVVKETSAGAMFGLVYSSSSTESVLRDEAIVMPCLTSSTD